MVAVWFGLKGVDVNWKSCSGFVELTCNYQTNDVTGQKSPVHSGYKQAQQNELGKETAAAVLL